MRAAEGIGVVADPQQRARGEPTLCADVAEAQEQVELERKIPVAVRVHEAGRTKPRNAEHRPGDRREAVEEVARADVVGTVGRAHPAVLAMVVGRHGLRDPALCIDHQGVGHEHVDRGRPVQRGDRFSEIVWIDEVVVVQHDHEFVRLGLIVEEPALAILAAVDRLPVEAEPRVVHGGDMPLDRVGDLGSGAVVADHHAEVAERLAPEAVDGFHDQPRPVQGGNAYEDPGHHRIPYPGPRRAPWVLLALLRPERLRAPTGATHTTR